MMMCDRGHARLDFMAEQCAEQIIGGDARISVQQIVDDTV